MDEFQGTLGLSLEHGDGDDGLLLDAVDLDVERAVETEEFEAQGGEDEAVQGAARGGEGEQVGVREVGEQQGERVRRGGSGGGRGGGGLGEAVEHAEDLGVVGDGALSEGGEGGLGDGERGEQGLQRGLGAGNLLH